MVEYGWWGWKRLSHPFGRTRRAGCVVRRSRAQSSGRPSLTTVGFCRPLTTVQPGVAALRGGGAWWAGRSCADRRRSDRARGGPGCQGNGSLRCAGLKAEGEVRRATATFGDLLAAAVGDLFVAVPSGPPPPAAVLGGLDERPAQ